MVLFFILVINKTAATNIKRGLGAAQRNPLLANDAATMPKIESGVTII
jgi:hypothetical protein